MFDRKCLWTSEARPSNSLKRDAFLRFAAVKCSRRGLVPREKVPLQEHYSAVIAACRLAPSRKTGLPKSYSWLPGVKMSGRSTAGTPGRGSTSRMETVGRRHGPVATRRVIGMRAGPVGSGLLLSISGLR